MYRHPRTIKQLNGRLDYAITEVFPFGKHKGQLAAEVVKTDPNYIVWWHETFRYLPLDIKVVNKGYKTYKHLSKAGIWKGSIGTWDHWGDEGDWEEIDDWPEGVLGDPWDPAGPF